MCRYKVLVIGLDGATFNLIQPWIRQGKLPTISNLVKRGSCGKLRSVIPPVSPQAWTSFLTGKNPGKHGIFGFAERRDEEYLWRVCTSKSRVASTLWDILTDHGRKAGFFFVPFTYPPQPLNGLMICGLGAPGVESNFTYPPELKTEIITKFGKGSIFEPEPFNKSPKEYLRGLLATIDRQTEIVKDLLNQEDFDLTVMVFSQSDRVQHFYWKQMDETFPGYNPEEDDEIKNAIFRVYQKLDDSIAQLIAEVDRNTAIIVMSDHGAGPYYKDVYLNNWLRRLGLLAYRKDNRSVLTSRLLKFSIWFAKRYLPRKAQGRLKILLRSNSLARLESAIRNPLASAIDWPRTRAYSYGTFGNIYLNLKGRELQGSVKPGNESEELLNLITQELYKLVDPETGEQMIEAVYRREDLYHGPLAFKSPDLIVKCKDTYFIKPEPDENHHDVFAVTHKLKGIRLEHTCNHRMNGILIASGGPIRSGVQITGATIMDLAPTILYLLGIPIPDDMDGKVLVDLFTDAFLSINEIQYQNTAKPQLSESEEGYSAKEAKEIEEKLRGLGYL